MKTFEFFNSDEKTKNEGMLKYANCGKPPFKNRKSVIKFHRSLKRSMKFKEIIKIKNEFGTI